MKNRTQFQTNRRQTAATQVAVQLRAIRNRWGELPESAVSNIAELLANSPLSVTAGHILYLNSRWYITHSGLLQLAAQKKCSGVRVHPVRAFCDPQRNSWVFKAIVYKSAKCKGFVGYGDADPSNVSPLVRGAEMRVAETRAVNRALRKAYGIGLCSVEEIGASSAPAEWAHCPPKRSPQRVNGSGNGNGHHSLRDRLSQVIRQHQLNPALVKLYAIEYCGTKELRQASREQIERFVNHLAQSAAQNRDALVCQLNNYSQKDAGIA